MTSTHGDAEEVGSDASIGRAMNRQRNDACEDPYEECLRRWWGQSYSLLMMTPSEPSSAVRGDVGLLERYEGLLERVGKAAIRSKRRPQDIVVVLVSKYGTIEQIRELINLGHKHFGESRAQQLEQRAAQVGEWLARRAELAVTPESDQPMENIRWHMVGHLQRNKVKKIVECARLVHGVDSLRLAEEIQAIASKREDPVEVLVQVNSSGERQKHGIAPPAVVPLIDQIDTMVNVSVRGLMTMAENTKDTGVVRGTFDRCQELFEETKQLGVGGDDFNVLSMGMSDDFEIAIECGANCIRVGSVVFQDEGRNSTDGASAESAGDSS